MDRAQGIPGLIKTTYECVWLLMQDNLAFFLVLMLSLADQETNSYNVV